MNVIGIPVSVTGYCLPVSLTNTRPLAVEEDVDITANDVPAFGF